MDDLLRILEITTFATSFIAYNYSAIRIVLKFIYTIIKIFSIHICTKSYHLDSLRLHTGRKHIYKFPERICVSGKDNNLTFRRRKHICLLFNIVYGSKKSSFDHVRIFIESHVHKRVLILRLGQPFVRSAS